MPIQIGTPKEVYEEPEANPTGPFSQSNGLHAHVYTVKRKPKDIEQPDLGILFVHGIGEQTRGETLLSGGEPLYHFVKAWLTKTQE